MAALLLGCGALLSERIRKRQRERRKDKEEYDRRFEEFKAENQRWEIRRQSYYGHRHDSQSSSSDDELNQDPSRTDFANSNVQPPSYDSAIQSPQPHANPARNRRPSANVQQGAISSPRQHIATKDVQSRDRNHW